jgi:hypothetical protein
MTNEELKALKYADSTFAWMNIEHGFISQTNDIFVIVIPADDVKSMATELLDARARIPHAVYGQEE